MKFLRFLSSSILEMLRELFEIIFNFLKTLVFLYWALLKFLLKVWIVFIPIMVITGEFPWWALALEITGAIVWFVCKSYLAYKE